MSATSPQKSFGTFFMTLKSLSLVKKVPIFPFSGTILLWCFRTGRIMNFSLFLTVKIKTLIEIILGVC